MEPAVESPEQRNGYRAEPSSPTSPAQNQGTVRAIGLPPDRRRICALGSFSDSTTGDAVAVGVSDTIAYVGGHFDWVDAEFRRKHAVAFDFEGIALPWDL